MSIILPEFTTVDSMIDCLDRNNYPLFLLEELRKYWFTEWNFEKGDAETFMVYERILSEIEMASVKVEVVPINVPTTQMTIPVVIETVSDQPDTELIVSTTRTIVSDSSK